MFNDTLAQKLHQLLGADTHANNQVRCKSYIEFKMVV